MKKLNLIINHLLRALKKTYLRICRMDTNNFWELKQKLFMDLIISFHQKNSANMTINNKTKMKSMMSIGAWGIYAYLNIVWILWSKLVYLNSKNAWKGLVAVRNILRSNRYSIVSKTYLRFQKICKIHLLCFIRWLPIHYFKLIKKKTIIYQTNKINLLIPNQKNITNKKI